MEKLLKRSLALLLSALLFATLLPPAAFKASAAGRAFDSTDIMEDLNSIEGFDPLLYPPYPSKDPEMHVLDFVEYCYDDRENMRDNFALYLYLYNPNRQELVKDSLKNNVKLAVKYDTDPVTEKSVALDWEAFDLIFCAMSGDGLFYKFRVLDHESADGKTVAERVAPGLRRYDVSEIELQTAGEPNATAYPVSTSYQFTGYAEGYGDVNRPLERSTLTTVELDLHHTAYRFPYINQNGAGHQNQLDSVYFAVPKGFQEEYGELYRVKCSWNEQKTAPVIVTNRQEIYEEVATHLGTDGSGAKYGIFDNFIVQDVMGAGSLRSADWAFNKNVGGLFITSPDTPYVGYVFKSEKNNVLDEYISSEKMKQWIYSHSFADYLFTDAVDEGRTKGKQESTFTADEPFNMLTFNQTASGWDKFCLNWQAFWTGKSWDFGPEQQAPVDPIRPIQDTDFTGTDVADAGKLYVHAEDFDEFKTFYDTNKAENDVFLLRFAVTDYYCNLAGVWDGEFLSAMDETSTYMAQETVFLDFDVISLTFLRDTTETVIPAVASPIDAVGGIDPPIVEDRAGLIEIIIAIAVLLVIGFLIFKICEWIFAGRKRQ